MHGDAYQGCTVMGELHATGCVVERNGSGVLVSGTGASAELIQCVVRHNRDRGLVCSGGGGPGEASSSVTLRGGAVIENGVDGVVAQQGGRVRVLEGATSDKNGGDDWLVVGEDAGSAIFAPLHDGLGDDD